MPDTDIAFRHATPMDRELFVGAWVRMNVGFRAQGIESVPLPTYGNGLRFWGMFTLPVILHGKEGVAVVASRERRAGCAFAEVMPSPFVDAKRIALVHMVFVEPELRSHGIGRSMLKWVEQELVKLNVGEMQTFHYPNKSKNSYLEGYRSIGEVVAKKLELQLPR